MEKLNAAQLLRDDHKRIKGLFRQSDAIDVKAHDMKEGVIRQIFMELNIHSKLKEDIFYPLLEDSTDSNLLGRVEEAKAVLQTMDNQITELQRIAYGDVRFSDKLRELIETAELHFEEEEKYLLSQAENHLALQEQETVEKMKALRKDLLSQPQFQDAQPEIVQNPSGGEQKRKTRAA